MKVDYLCLHLVSNNEIASPSAKIARQFSTSKRFSRQESIVIKSQQEISEKIDENDEENEQATEAINPAECSLM